MWPAKQMRKANGKKTPEAIHTTLKETDKLRKSE